MGEAKNAQYHDNIPTLMTANCKEIGPALFKKSVNGAYKKCLIAARNGCLNQHLGYISV